MCVDEGWVNVVLACLFTICSYDSGVRATYVNRVSVHIYNGSKYDSQVGPALVLPFPFPLLFLSPAVLWLHLLQGQSCASLV